MSSANVDDNLLKEIKACFYIEKSPSGRVHIARCLNCPHSFSISGNLKLFSHVCGLAYKDQAVKSCDCSDPIFLALKEKVKAYVTLENEEYMKKRRMEGIGGVKRKHSSLSGDYVVESGEMDLSQYIPDRAASISTESVNIPDLIKAYLRDARLKLSTCGLSAINLSTIRSLLDQGKITPTSVIACDSDAELLQIVHDNEALLSPADRKKQPYITMKWLDSEISMFIDLPIAYLELLKVAEKNFPETVFKKCSITVDRKVVNDLTCAKTVVDGSVVVVKWESTRLDEFTCAEARKLGQIDASLSEVNLKHAPDTGVVPAKYSEYFMRDLVMKSRVMTRGACLQAVIPAILTVIADKLSIRLLNKYKVEGSIGWGNIEWCFLHKDWPICVTVGREGQDIDGVLATHLSEVVTAREHAIYTLSNISYKAESERRKIIPSIGIAYCNGEWLNTWYEWNNNSASWEFTSTSAGSIHLPANIGLREEYEDEKRQFEIIVKSVIGSVVRHLEKLNTFK